ncbi:MAG TPA: tetratricopeptide repeat protein [Kofleriaceae bacterium]|nr:tetratricopeptide repeat protein [Kofleriaceae bacterium]
MAVRRRLAIALSCAAVACGPPKQAGPPPPLPYAAYAHYLGGKLAGYRDEWSNAADALAEAAAAAPDQPIVAVELARAQQKAKRPEAARATLAAARARWPGHPQVWIASGDLLAPIAKLRPEAMAAYRKAIELDPSGERAYLGLAKLQEPREALVTLARLVRRVPDSVEGRYRLGVRLATARELGAATRQMRAVLERDPDHIDARLDLARLLRYQGQLDEAVAQTRSAFDRSGQAPDVAEELFWVLCEADDRTGALDLLTLLDDERSDVDVLAMVARLYRGLARFDDARRIAARIGKLDADAGALATAEIEHAAGDPAAAARRAMAIGAASERYADARRVAASAYLAAGEPRRAHEAIAPALAKHPKRGDLAAVAGFALAELGRLEEARAVGEPFGEPARSLLLARIADHAGDPAAALRIVEPIARGAPEQASALNLAGYLLADRNERLADAEAYLRRARELAPGDPAVLDSWGWLLFRRGRYREAVRVLDRAARFAPREPEILVHLAAAWAADGAPRTAAAVLDRAAALRPTPAVQRRIDHVRSRLASRKW